MCLVNSAQTVASFSVNNEYWGLSPIQYKSLAGPRPASHFLEKEHMKEKAVSQGKIVLNEDEQNLRVGAISILEHRGIPIKI